MVIKCKDEQNLMILLLWTDPFQPETDWIGACYSVDNAEWDNGTIVTDGIGG